MLARVEVRGLESAAGQLLNGQPAGVLRSFDAQRERWAVAMMDSGLAGG